MPMTGTVYFFRRYCVGYFLFLYFPTFRAHYKIGYGKQLEDNVVLTTSIGCKFPSPISQDCLRENFLLLNPRA